VPSAWRRQRQLEGADIGFVMVDFLMTFDAGVALLFGRCRLAGRRDRTVSHCFPNARRRGTSGLCAFQLNTFPLRLVPSGLDTNANPTLVARWGSFFNGDYKKSPSDFGTTSGAIFSTP
jgi:hypothetical protein